MNDRMYQGIMQFSSRYLRFIPSTVLGLFYKLSPSSTIIVQIAGNTVSYFYYLEKCINVNVANINGIFFSTWFSFIKFKFKFFSSHLSLIQRKLTHVIFHRILTLPSTMQIHKNSFDPTFYEEWEKIICWLVVCCISKKIRYLLAYANCVHLVVLTFFSWRIINRNFVVTITNDIQFTFFYLLFSIVQ